MNLKDIKKLRKKLPPQYAKELSGKLTGIDRTQVSRVFSGEITNSEIVSQVINAAIEYLTEQKQQEEDLSTALNLLQ